MRASPQDGFDVGSKSDRRWGTQSVIAQRWRSHQSLPLRYFNTKSRKGQDGVYLY
jgi:hypothetical protein